MDQQRGPWTIHQTSHIYQDDFVTLLRDEVTQPDGKPGHYARVEMLAGVAILALGADDTVYLVRQFRYALGRESTEVVCGALDRGETAEAAAARELREELGITAARWQALGKLDLDTSIVHCPVALFVARDLSFGSPEREGTETIRRVEVPWSTAIQQVLDGEITHAPSCTLILKAAIERQNS